MKPYFLILSLLISGCQPATKTVYPTDQLTLESNCTQTNLTIGEVIEFTITTTYPPEALIQLPELGRKKEIIQLERNWEPVERADTLEQTHYHYRLTSFELGTHQISTNSILFTYQGETHAHPFPPIVLNVISSLPPDAPFKLAPLRPPHPLPARLPRWLIIVIIAGIIAYIMGRLSTRLWKNRTSTKPTPPPIPAHLIALRQLEVLRAGPLMQAQQSEPFVTELSCILRRYLEARFQLNAPDQTTEEILADLTRSPALTPQQQTTLNTFLQQADVVKFAKGEWERTAMDEAFQTTRTFVQDTAQHPEGEPT
ncbi:MAG: hypothetical protein CMF27_02815 [Kiritimatiellaceae bacterium]|jgi:hypothetical protein|nr:hypothetical protein [Kiritimatiellaceae bacterium]